MTVPPPLAQPVALAALSPDGRLVALVRHRTETNDLVARERVHVHELSTGDEVFALDGPDVVRTLAWASPERLLVARDGRRGASTLTLHEAPDGGAVGRREIPHLAQHRARVTFSRDGGRALVTSPEAFDCKGDPHEVARVLAVPSLDVVGEVDCAAVGAALGMKLLAREALALHPDGHLVAAAESAPRGAAEAAVAVIPAGRPGEARVVARVPRYAAALHWLGPRSLVLRCDSPVARARGEGVLTELTCDDTLAGGEARAVLGGDAGPWVTPLGVHPDGDRLLALVGRRGEDMGDLPATWNDVYPDYVEVIRCSTRERLDLGENEPYADHDAAWASGGRAVAKLRASAGGMALEVTDLATGRRARHTVVPPGERARPDGLQCAGPVAMVTVMTPDGRMALTFVNVTGDTP